MENKIPDRLFVSNRDDYKRLLEKDSPLTGKENKHIFMIAMLIGFKEGRRVELPRGKKDLIRIEYLNDEEISVIKAIAVIEEGNLDVLLDKRKVYSIAEEYAACGIKLLKNKVFDGGYGSFIKKFESELIDEFKKFEEELCLWIIKKRYF